MVHTTCHKCQRLLNQWQSGRDQGLCFRCKHPELFWIVLVVIPGPEIIRILKEEWQWKKTPGPQRVLLRGNSNGQP